MAGVEGPFRLARADLESDSSASECNASSADEGAQPPMRSRALIGGVVAAVGAFALAVCALLVATRSTTVAARELLESDETVDVLARNVMALDQRDDSEWQSIRDSVEKAAHTVSAEVRQEKPEAYAALGDIQLSPNQKRAVLRHLRSVGDPRVRSIAQDIVNAFKETVAQNGDREALKQSLVAKLGPRMAEVRQLRDLYFPQHIGGPADRAPSLEASHLDNMPIVQHFDEWRAQFAADAVPIRQLQATTTESSSMMGKMMTYFKDMMSNFKEKLGNMNPFSGASEAEYSNGATNLVSCISTAMTDSTSDVSTCFSELMASFSGTTLR